MGRGLASIARREIGRRKPPYPDATPYVIISMDGTVREGPLALCRPSHAELGYQVRAEVPAATAVW
jgi:hypothetical protein